MATKLTTEESNEIVTMIRRQALILGTDLSDMSDIDLVTSVTRLVKEAAAERGDFWQPHA